MEKRNSSSNASQHSRGGNNSRGGGRSSGGGYKGRNSRGGNRSGNSRGRKYHGRGGGGGQRGRRRFSGEKIPHHKYIAKAEPGYVAPSIFVEDSFFYDFDIHETLKKNIKMRGYKHPSKIQHQAIPEIIKGKDILGMASTGSGKTGAFLIPMINKVINDRQQKVLIITPTRELAQQIQDEFMPLARHSNLFSTVVIGGARVQNQIRSLKKRPEFVIGTPGRLKDLFERGILNLHLFNNIVLDEVDRMLDMGFVPDITFLLSKISKQKQSLFFSATMSPDAEKIANTLLIDPVRLQVEKESPLKRVDQDIVKTTGIHSKVNTMIEMLRKPEFDKVLVFSRTKRGADRLATELQNAGLKADAIHGGKTQNRRQRVLNSFSNNALNILVATDVAARGLDIPDVTHVINFDEPDTYKDYIHRIGRTGRAGKTGTALTFVS